MSTEPFIVPICHEDVEILYQDDALLMVNKPTSLLSVPGRHPANRDCLISRIQQTLPEARIVHRLDMDTSGVMVLALDANSHRALNKQFEQRQVMKQYEAVVFGLIEQASGTINAPMCCDWPNRPKQMVDHNNGKPSITHFEVISRENSLNRTRVRLSPVTGRSHQLRVHLAHIDHPILGCDFYAHPQALSASPRLLLHASYLKVTHPNTGETVEMSVPTPF